MLHLYNRITCTCTSGGVNSFDSRVSSWLVLTCGQWSYNCMQAYYSRFSSLCKGVCQRSEGIYMTVARNSYQAVWLSPYVMNSVMCLDQLWMCAVSSNHVYNTYIYDNIYDIHSNNLVSQASCIFLVGGEPYFSGGRSTLLLPEKYGWLARLQTIMVYTRRCTCTHT